MRQCTLGPARGDNIWTFYLNLLFDFGLFSNYCVYIYGCRSYKNGYVWNDLCDDDILHPAHGNDYILKGTELFEKSNPGNRIISFYKLLVLIGFVLWLNIPREY